MTGQFAQRVAKMMKDTDRVTDAAWVHFLASAFSPICSNMHNTSKGPAGENRIQMVTGIGDLSSWFFGG